MKNMERVSGFLLAVLIVVTMGVSVFADADAETIEALELSKGQFRTIKPAVKAFSTSYSAVRIRWARIDGVDGYKVYRAVKKSGRYSLIKTVSDSAAISYTNTGRTTGTTYYYKVRGFKKIGKTTYYTNYSAISSAYARPAKAAITKVYLPKDEQVKVMWNKVSGATGYQVYRKRTDKSTWKLFKTVSSKYTSVTDKMLGNASKPFGPGGETWYDHDDLKYDWEYKVRAYRTVNGKKVYGLFSAAQRFTPEWTIEEICEELWKYGESLEWPMYEVVSTYPDPDANGDYIKKKSDGSTYNMKHVVGINKETGDVIYTNPNYGNTAIPSKFERWTEENCSWYVCWPCTFNRYDKKTSVLKMLKESLYADLESTSWSNPLYWDPLWDATGAGYTGANLFSIYYEYSKKNGEYSVWGLW